MSVDNLVIIVCPPLSLYDEQPKDQSISTPEDCPLCKSKMWLSEKKKRWIEICETAKKEIYLACYTCFTDAVTHDKKIRKAVKESKTFKV